MKKEVKEALRKLKDVEFIFYMLEEDNALLRELDDAYRYASRAVTCIEEYLGDETND